MALTRGSPEPHARALPSAWTYSDGGSTLQEAQEALDSYKKKDGNKGACTAHRIMHRGAQAES